MAYTPFPGDAVVSGTPVSKSKFGDITVANLNDHESRMVTVESGKVPTSRLITAGTGLTGGGDLSANRTLAADFGTAAGKVAQGNDSRITVTQDASIGNSALDAKISALGPIAEITVSANSGTTTGADLIWANTGGITLVNGAKYRVSFDTGYDFVNTSGTDPASTAVFCLYYVAGSTATLTGATRFYRRLTRATAVGAFLNTNGLGRLTGPSSATYTIMATIGTIDANKSYKTNGGTPNATDNQGYLTVDRVR